MARPSLPRNDYYRALELERDPFASGYSADTYFITPELRHRLDLVRHLLEFSQQLLFIKGAEKTGKTVFCQHLIAGADEDWAVCKIDATSELGPDTLVKSLLSMQTQPLNGSSETISALNNYLQHCNSNSITPIVFIDDADKLVEETLRFIIQLAEFREKQTSLKVVLVAKDFFLDRLNRIAEEKSNSSLIHSVSIPAFSLQQTSEYLSYKVHACGGRKDLFSDKEVIRIHKVSAGLAGDIDFLARQGMSDPVLLVPSSSAQGTNRVRARRGGQIFKVFLAAAVVAGIIIFAFSQNREVPRAVTRTVSVDLPPQRPATISDIPDSVKENEESVVMPDTGADTEAASYLDPAATASKTVADRGSEKRPGGEPGRVVEGPPVVKEKLFAAEEPLTVKTSVIPDMRGNEWLMAQSPDNFVLQLIGAVELETVSRFLEAARLNEYQLALYKVKKSGNDWHVLVYGLYSDLSEARAAISKLPAKAKAQKPWPKAVRAIHAEINAR